MADCECIPGCIFFNDKMANMPALANSYKRQYCKGDKSNCARYIIFKAKGKGRVPSDLFPNNQSKAKVILEKG